MRRLLLVRHGESTWNAERRWQGQADPPLSRRGEQQARCAGLSVARLEAFDAVYASPLRRALRTAELLAAGAGLPGPVPVPDLRERAAGPWEGLTHAEIDACHPGARLGRWRPPGYEPDAALRGRATAALLGLRGERVLVVAHEGLILALTGDAAGLPNLGARWFSCSADGLRPGEPVTLCRSTGPQELAGK